MNSINLIFSSFFLSCIKPVASKFIVDKFDEFFFPCQGAKRDTFTSIVKSLVFVEFWSIIGNAGQVGNEKSIAETDDCSEMEISFSFLIISTPHSLS
jgi:hypothetical protein